MRWEKVSSGVYAQGPWTLRRVRQRGLVFRGVRREAESWDICFHGEMVGWSITLRGAKFKVSRGEV